MKSYLRHVIELVYEVLRFITFLKGYRIHRARNSNLKSRKKRIEFCSRKLKKEKEGRKTFFSKTKEFRGS